MKGYIEANNFATTFRGLGCACEHGMGDANNFATTFRGLGKVLTRTEVENFFIGTNKYTRNTKPTPIYDAPGGAAIQTIAPNENMGKVVYINAGLNWGKLDNGKWIYLADSMYTDILTVPPPTSITNALSREAEKVVSFGLEKIIVPVIIGVGVLLLVESIGKSYITAKVKAA